MRLPSPTISPAEKIACSAIDEALDNLSDDGSELTLSAVVDLPSPKSVENVVEAPQVCVNITHMNIWCSP